MLGRFPWQGSVLFEIVGDKDVPLIDASVTGPRQFKGNTPDRLVAQLNGCSKCACFEGCLPGSWMGELSPYKSAATLSNFLKDKQGFKQHITFKS